MYIGVTTKTIRERWALHILDSSCCRYLKYAIKKYGKTNFSIEVIFHANSIEEMLVTEEDLINKLNTLSPNGYNLKSGGQFGLFSDESKERCSISQKNRWENKKEREKYSTNMKQQWKNSELREQRSIGIRDYVQKKKKPICGKSIKTDEIIQFESLLAASNAGYHDSNITKSIKNNKPYRGFMWFFL